MRLHTPATVNRTEAWLKQQAKDGWKLVEYNGWYFVFRQCTPYDGEYLMYSSFRSEKGLSADFYTTKTIYGKAKGKSELNKKSLGIFEADLTKLDKEYFHFVKMRNSYYLKQYIFIIVFSVFAFLLALVAILLEPTANQNKFLLFVSLPFLIYSAISLIILLKDIKKLKNSLEF